MGINYSINLYFEVNHVERALNELTALAVLGGGPVAIRFPSGHQVTFPLSRGPANGSCHLRPGAEGIELFTTFRFAIDDSIRNEVIQGLPALDENWAEVGLDLYVQAGWHFAEMSFYTETSSTSSMLLCSESIHRVFQDLLIRAGGLAGVVDCEGERFLSLNGFPHQLVVDIEDFFDDEQNLDVDGFTTALLIECDRLREQA